MQKINSSALKPEDFASSHAFIIVMAVGGAEYEVCEAVERQPPGLSVVARPNNMKDLLDELHNEGRIYVNLSLVRPTIRTKYRLVRRHERFATLGEYSVSDAKLRSTLPEILDLCDENIRKYTIIEGELFKDEDDVVLGTIVPGVQTPLALLDDKISSENFKKKWRTLTGPTPITRSNKVVALFLPPLLDDDLEDVPAVDDVIDESVLEKKSGPCYVDENLYPKNEVSENALSAPKSNGFDYDGYALFLRAFSEVMAVDHPSLPREMLRKLGEITLKGGFSGEDLSGQIDGPDIHELFCNIVRGFEAISRHRFSEDVHVILYG